MSRDKDEKKAEGADGREKKEIRRRFIVLGHCATTGSAFPLNDLCGAAGRLDNLLRCVNAALLLSHRIRTDTEIQLILMGAPAPPKTIRFVGSEVKYLNPDERSTAALIKKALEASEKDFNFELDEEVRSSDGIYISRKSLRDVLEGVKKERGTIALLSGDGLDIREIDFASTRSVTFILGDDKEVSADEKALIQNHATHAVRLGPLELHAAHCIVVAHNELDRKMF